jgi:outer membrane cobalamin receptor
MVVLGSATCPCRWRSRPVCAGACRWRKAHLVATPLDPLRSDASIFLEQRGAGGAQTDITLRGGSFAQTLVLLNGFRINDSQAAHHNLDLPVPLEAMDSIQVLHGAGSTLHGADALSGVQSIFSPPPHAEMLRCQLRLRQLRQQ